MKFLKILLFLKITICASSPNRLKLKFQEHENETQLEISGLENTLTYETISQFQNVSKLKILDNKLTGINPGAICSAPQIQSVELNFAGNPKAPTLTKSVFRQCHLQLKNLYLRFDFDNPSRLEENALEDLNLETLSLQCYQLESSSINLKLKREKVQHLILSNCFTSSLDENYFNDFHNLEHLEISYNRNLTFIPKNLFQNLKNLRTLNLRFNRIRELEWDEFSNLSYLEDLNLSGNRIAFFDAAKISKFLPNLKRLEILKNVSPCRLKEKFAESLRSAMNSTVVVVFSLKPCRTYF